MGTQTITAGTHKELGYWGTTGVSYATVHNAAVGEVTSNTEVGQRYISGTDQYTIFRYAMIFDTSDISSLATISAAKVQIYANQDNSTTDFDVTVVSGTDIEDVPVDADYGDILDDTTSFGTWNTGSYTTAQYEDIDLNATGITAIVEEGTTKFALRSSRDIGSTTPTGLEHIHVVDDSNYSTTAPKLVITYTGEPTVTTQACTNTIAEKSTGHGNITSIGAATVTAHGHCWSTTTNPTISGGANYLGAVDNGAAPNLGQFQSAITGLTPGTTYYVRAYATNVVDTAYGGNVTINATSTIGRRHIWTEQADFHYFDEHGVERVLTGATTTSDHGGIMDWM